DDGSSDDTVAVAQRFGPAVQVCCIPHGGPGAARNAGIVRAGGEVLAFLDADDLWQENKLELQLAALAATPELDMVFGLVDHFYSPELDGAARAVTPLPPSGAPGYLPSAWLVRRAALERVGPLATDLAVGEFIGWFIRAKECGLRWSVVPQVVARRRIHAANTARARGDNHQDYVRILKASLNRRRAAATT
ncbi:glycosyltransferase family A protein, partial [uncultured Arthrobacter sp.]|uniref:glycosyltransferase family A protein n=1 Tax=uncultured Arthrobacter sp. TaxID=114050 RepID=UPI003218006C